LYKVYIDICVEISTVDIMNYDTNGGGSCRLTEVVTLYISLPNTTTIKLIVGCVFLNHTYSKIH